MQCWMGLSALSGGAKEEAARLLLDAVKQDPLSADALRGLEECLAALGDQERAAKAADLRRRAEGIRKQLRELRASPARFEERGEALLTLAEACRSANQFREARRYFQLAREAAPLNPTAQRAVAEVLVGPEERFFKAQALASIIRLRPDDGLARRGLALVLARTGVRLDHALELSGGTATAAEVPESTYVLGEVLLARDDLEGAARAAEAAQAANPGEKRYQDLVQRIQARQAEKP
jgi:tetratricopeptide (TPR) repeat protein